MALEIKIDLGNATQHEVMALVEMLQVYDRHAIKAQVQEGTFVEGEAVRRPLPSQLPVALPATSVAADLEERGFTENQAEAMTVDKPKRGRPRKTEAAPEQENPTPASAPAAESPEAGTSPSAEPTTEASSDTEANFELAAGIPVEKASIEVLRKALQQYVVKHGLSEGMILVKSFGVDRVTELADMSAEVHAAFLAKAGE